MVFVIESQRASLLHPSAPADPAAMERFGQYQAALVRSRLTLSAAINTPGILEIALFRDASPDPLSWLADNLRVTLNPSSNLMTVELDGEDEKEVIRVLDAIRKAYMARTMELSNRSLTRRHEDLEKVIAERKQELVRDTRRLEQITASIGWSSGLATLAFGDQFMAKEYERIVDELSRAHLDRAQYLANLAAPRHKGPESAPITVAGGVPAALPQQPAAAPDGLDTPEGKVLAAREQFWRSKMDDIQRVIKENNERAPELNNLRLEIRAREAALERYYAALQELQDELRAPSRVWIMEEPCFRLGK